MRSEYWQQRYRLFKNELPEIPKNSVVFLGDSIIEGFPLAALFPDWNTINRGINGDHIDGVIERLDVSATKLQPDRLYVMIGINDIGKKRSTSYMREQYEQLFPLLKNKLNETSIFIHSLLPVGSEYGYETIKQLKEINFFLKEYSKPNTFNFVDLFDKYVDGEGFLNQKFSNDGLHLNLTGYRMWAKTLHDLL